MGKLFAFKIKQTSFLVICSAAIILSHCGVIPMDSQIRTSGDYGDEVEVFEANDFSDQAILLLK